MNMDDRLGGPGVISQAVTNEVSLSEDIGIYFMPLQCLEG